MTNEQRVTDIQYRLEQIDNELDYSMSHTRNDALREERERLEAELERIRKEAEHEIER